MPMKEEKVFELYVSNIKDFDGQLYFHKIKEYQIDVNLDDFDNLLSWYGKKESQSAIKKILQKKGIDIKKNKDKSIIKSEKIRKGAPSKAPTTKSFEFMGMIHEH